MAYRTAPEPTETTKEPEPEYIPYGLEEFWKPCKVLCTICHIFRGGRYDKEAMAVFDRLTVKFRLNLSSRFYQDYRAFSNFKPELLTSKDEIENYVSAYKYGAFTELRNEIEADLKGQSPEAIEAKRKQEEREKAFQEFKENNNQDKKFVDFLGV